ncbi:MAG TPA: DUF1456 family protein [Flavobacterium sp.]|nr:DUF1456 family protein [Flavobacterium sp.]
MTNNDIFKKLRVALQLRDDQIVDILQLVDFRISKGEIGNFFRAEDHPKYMECQDQVLRNFLNGLVIFLRGTKENPKNPMDVLATVKAEKKPLTEKEVVNKPKASFKPNTTKTEKRSDNNTKFKSTPTKKDILGNVKFNNGKPKKKNDQ